MRNIPFFVDEVALDDVVELVKLDSGEYLIGRVVQQSGNSTIWIYVKSRAGDENLNQLKDLGCRIETGVIDGYFAVNVLARLNWSGISNAISEGVSCGSILVDYPCVRANHSGSAGNIK